MRIRRSAGGATPGTVDAPDPRRPVLVEEAVLVLLRPEHHRGPGGDRAAGCPATTAMDWKRTARSRVSAVSTAQRTSSPAMTTPWLRSSAARR